MVAEKVGRQAMEVMVASEVQASTSPNPPQGEGPVSSAMVPPGGTAPSRNMSEKEIRTIVRPVCYDASNGDCHKKK